MQTISRIFALNRVYFSSAHSLGVTPYIKKNWRQETRNIKPRRRGSRVWQIDRGSRLWVEFLL